MSLISGYCDDADLAIHVESPVVIFGDHTCTIKFVDFDFAVGADGVKILAPIAGLDARFLFYFLLNNPVDVKGYARHYRFIKDLAIPLPPLEEQERIVAILDEAFAAIETATANTEKNLANARELFESELNRVFSQKGEGWVEKTLGEVCEKITKGSSPKWQGISYVNAPGILFITSENVGTNAMNYGKLKYVEERFNEKDSKSVLQRGDVLTNIVGASIGRTAVYDRDVPANINQAVCLIRCNSEKLINHYLSFLLNSPFFKCILHDNEINNARANLSLGFFRSLRIPIPSIADQTQQVSYLNQAQSACEELSHTYMSKLAAITELKQSVLQKAFTGELTADPKTADRVLSEAGI
jgi:type I restriction enzyme S subunit